VFLGRARLGRKRWQAKRPERRGIRCRQFFEYCGAQQVEFIIRAAYDRWVEVFNERLNRWEHEHLKDLVDSARRRYQAACSGSLAMARAAALLS
jgi:hypothetical protein